MSAIPERSFESQFFQWQRHFEAYRQLLRKAAKKSKPQQAQFKIEKFWRWLQAHEILPQNLMPYHFVAYAQDLHSNQLCIEVEAYSKATVAIYLGAAKAWSTHLCKSGVLLQDPFADFHAGHPRKDLYQRSLSKEQVQRILALPDLSRPWGLRDRALFEVLYGSGLRVGEAAALTLESLDLDQGLVHLRDTKNTWDRCVPLTNPAIESLIRYLENGRHQIQGPGVGQALWLTYHHNVLTRDGMVNLGARYSARIDFQFHLHSLRHACATHLLEGGAKLRHIAELLGHSALHSTSHYAKVRATELARVHRQTHPRA